MFRLCVLVAALLWPLAPAVADIPRPLDERATARLVVAAIAEVDPALKVTLGMRGGSATVVVPGKRPFFVRLDDIHAALRAEPDGARREELLKAHVAEELAELNDLATEKQKLVLDKLLEFEGETVMPILRTPDPKTSWEVPSSAHLPFAGGMVVFWVQDREISGTRAGPILARWMREQGLDKMKLRELGLANLEARLDRVTEARDGRFLTLSLDGHFGSSLMVLDGYWQKMAQDGQVLTAAVPREDQLIVIADATEAEIAELRMSAGATYTYCDRCRDDPLSPDLFRWTGTGWEILPE